MSEQTLIICGGKPLNGIIELRGAKNAVPKEMVAGLLSDESSLLSNVPDIADVDIVSGMIQALGGEVEREDGRLKITPKKLHQPDRKDFAKFIGRSRIPILFIGPLLHRLGKAIIPKVGGDQIGPRPLDFHLLALEKLGAKIQNRGEFLEVTAKKLSGDKIRLDYPSVGATEQVLLSAVMADGITELSNAAIEPEIMDLVMVLQRMGAIISVDTDRVITVVGVPKLKGFEHHVMADRIEAGSWACAAVATSGRIFVKNARQEDMLTFLNKLRQIGGGFNVKDGGIEFFREREELEPIALETDVHPGFMTDWQQPFVLTLTQANGLSVVHETVYENRFGYAQTLNSMGAKIQIFKECLGGRKCRFGQRNHLHSAVVAGPTVLHGAEVQVPDIRAGFSYVIAGLIAKGETKLENIHHIYRGYENFSAKLEAIGAKIRYESH